MPRSGRVSPGGICYHVLNRGNARRDVFLKDGDYRAFLQALADAHEQLPMRVLAWCLMPNHFHLALWPHADGDLGTWMHWACNAHVRRYHQHYHSSGHLWQGRYKSFPVQQDDHLLTLLRYIERNPVRAGLVERAEDWPWSSAGLRTGRGEAPAFFDPGPVALPRRWLAWVNQPLTEGELARVRHSVARGAPLGEPDWAALTAERLGLQASLRPRGRPRKQAPAP
jgi:putative transposase